MKNKKYQIITRSPEETKGFGAFLGKYLCAGSILALIGELGSGKTCLAQGIAHGLGVPKDVYVTSPTFSLVNEYAGRTHLVHVDLYRIESAGELDDIGLEEIMDTRNVLVIEWAEKAAEILPDDCLFVMISVLDDRTRCLQLTGRGHTANNLIEKCHVEFTA